MDGFIFVNMSPDLAVQGADALLENSFQTRGWVHSALSLPAPLGS